VSRDSSAKSKTHDRALIAGVCEKTRKLRFASRKAAKVTLRQMGDRDMNVYSCRSCDGFHMGHETADGKAKLREHGA